MALWQLQILALGLIATDREYGDGSSLPRGAPLTPRAHTHPLGGYSMPARPYAGLAVTDRQPNALQDDSARGASPGRGSLATHAPHARGAASRVGPEALALCA